MNDPPNDPAALRERAATMRQRAAAMHQVARNALLSAAETYEQLAKAADQAAVKRR
jgi:hypothetical protein